MGTARNDSKASCLAFARKLVMGERAIMLSGSELGLAAIIIGVSLLFADWALLPFPEYTWMTLFRHGAGLIAIIFGVILVWKDASTDGDVKR